MDTVRLVDGRMADEQAGEVAQAIYHALHGDLDSKRHRGETLAAIEDWLRQGDFDDGEAIDLDALAAEWREYAAE